jgi:hypothetical protein
MSGVQRSPSSWQSGDAGQGGSFRLLSGQAVYDGNKFRIKTRFINSKIKQENCNVVTL